MSKVEGWVLLLSIAMMGACAKAPIPYQEPVRATPPAGRVAVSDAVTVFDSSGSHEAGFAAGKATLESVVGVMPDGSYNAALVQFGGYDRVSTGASRFDRNSLKTTAKNAEFLEGVTPIFDVLESDVSPLLGGGSGQAAIVLISDGMTTDFGGRPGSEERTIAAARALAGSRSGKTCFHTIQSGEEVAGAMLLQSISEVTDCGSFRNASTLASAGELQKFSRQVYLGGKAPEPRRVPVAGPPIDTDGDGVIDPRDECPDTPKRAKADARGCWTLKNLRFAVNGAGIESGFTSGLKDDIAVLKANPGIRVRFDGYTDSDGPAAYNEALSLRRATAVRDYFVTTGGLDADRFEVKGFGEANPIAPNDTLENKRRNRRVELTIID